MIIYECKIGSTLVKFDDRDIGTKEENNKTVNTLLNISVKKLSEYF